MNCIECGGKTETLDTRHDKQENTLRRRRQCKACGHRFATIEAVAPEKVKPAPAPKLPKASPFTAPARSRAPAREPAAMLDSSWASVPDRLSSIKDLDYL